MLANRGLPINFIPATLYPMLSSLLESMSTFVTTTISHFGYLGVGALMAIESMNIPLPSEVILPFAGWQVNHGLMNFHGAALAGAVGCVVGSLISYALGYYGGRPFLLKYGKWLLVSQKDFYQAESWVAKYGVVTFFVGRVLPVARTFISLPAGILRVKLWPFVLTTFFGSWIWSYLLIYVGVRLGDEWETLKPLWHKFDFLIIGICLIAFILFVGRHIRQIKREQKALIKA